jgi:hypothetical protein
VTPMQPMKDDTEAEAALYFLPQGHYLFRWQEETGLAGSKFVTADDLSAAFAHSERDTGWLVPGIVRAGYSKHGDWFVMIRGPHVESLALEGIGTVSIPAPSLALAGPGTMTGRQVRRGMKVTASSSIYLEQMCYTISMAFRSCRHASHARPSPLPRLLAAPMRPGTLPLCSSAKIPPLAQFSFLGDCTEVTRMCGIVALAPRWIARRPKQHLFLFRFEERIFPPRPLVTGRCSIVTFNRSPVRYSFLNA